MSRYYHRGPRITLGRIITGLAPRLRVGWLILFAVLLIAGGFAHARDLDGRYAQSPLKEWFDGLKSGKGPCCSDADGSAVSDADWRVKGGHYQVRLDVSRVAPTIDMQWIDVPDEAVITEPNLADKTMV